MKLSYFLLALSENAIQEVMATSSLILYFKGHGNVKWHKTDASLLTKDRIYKLLLKNNNLKVGTIQEAPLPAQTIIRLIIRTWFQLRLSSFHV